MPRENPKLTKGIRTLKLDLLPQLLSRLLSQRHQALDLSLLSDQRISSQ